MRNTILIIGLPHKGIALGCLSPVMGNYHAGFLGGKGLRGFCPTRPFGDNRRTMEDRDKFQLVYSSLVSEINRYRDWPIRVLTFTSALHFGIIGAFLLKGLCVGIAPRILLSGVLSILWLWTVYYFYRCNENYLQARNT
jgi:hypothetical protein